MNLFKRGVIVLVGCGTILFNIGCNYSTAPFKATGNDSKQGQAPDQQETVPIQEEKKLQQITIIELPKKQQYFVGEDIDLTGIKLQAQYSDGSKADISLNDMVIEAVNMFQLGKHTVLLKNQDVKTSFEIDISFQDNDLPVVYIETNEHVPIDSKETYVTADMKICRGGGNIL